MPTQSTNLTHDPHRVLIKNNHLGLADYHCGICGKPLLKMVSVSDIDASIPEKCPYCNEYVVAIKR